MNVAHLGGKQSSHASSGPCIQQVNYLDKCAQGLWRDSEALWYGTMQRRHLENTVIHTGYDRIANFFKHGFHRSLSEDYQAPFMTEDLPDVAIENISKLAWLCDEFLDNHKKYDNPLCAHYDPRQQDNIVHPGGMRKVLLKLYCDPSHNVETYYFNTGGFYDPDTMGDLRIVTESEAQELHFNNDNLGIRGCLVADHGTLIPHLMVGSKVILDRQQEFLTRILKNVKNPDFKVFVNFEYPYHMHSYLDFLSSDPINSQVLIEVKQLRFSDYELNRILTLVVIHSILLRPFEDDTIKIIIQD